MATLHMTADNFKKTVEGNGTVVIDFWAPWCAPCRAFGPVFEKASEKHDGIVFAKVNTEEEQELAAAFNIRSIPTLMVFRDQILIFSQPGMLPPATFEELLTKVRALDMDKVREEIEHEDRKQQAPKDAGDAPASTAAN